jgi:DNA-binding Xre family transcriptional regulator
MAVSYKKLWHLCVDLNINKTRLREICRISPASVAKLTKGENLNTDTLLKICKALKCDVSDIMEVLPDDNDSEC